jgi:hypothetical protein
MIFSAAFAVYFSQSGLGTESMSPAPCLPVVKTEWSFLIEEKEGSCVARASRERMARRRLPEEMREMRRET